MAELYGIENLKKAVHVAIAIPVHGVKTIKSKFQIFDILSFINDIRELAELWKARAIVKLEAKDIHPTEREEILNYIKEEFDIVDDQAEGIFEDALVWVNSGVSLYERIKTALKK